jgi:hypothetical protein
MHGTCQSNRPKTGFLGSPDYFLPTTTNKFQIRGELLEIGLQQMKVTVEEKIVVIIDRLIHFKKKLPYNSQQSSESLMPMPKSKKEVYVC